MELLAMNKVLLVGLGALAVLTAGIATAQGRGGESGHPLLAPWAGPHGGVPPFDKVRVEDFRPALEAGMAEQLAEVERIADAAATRDLREHPRRPGAHGAHPRPGSDRLRRLEHDHEQPGVPGRRAGDGAEARGLPATRSSRTRSSFAASPPSTRLASRGSSTPEQKRLAWLYHTNFVRAGARLDAAAKKRLSEINQRLAALFTTFSQNVLADETDYVLVLENEADLAGLPESVRAAAAAAAESRGQEGPVGRPQHPLQRRAVPDLLRPAATCARRSGAPS